MMGGNVCTFKRVCHIPPQPADAAPLRELHASGIIKLTLASLVLLCLQLTLQQEVYLKLRKEGRTFLFFKVRKK